MSSYSDGLEAAARNAFCDITRGGVAGGLLFAGLTAETGAGLIAGLAASAVSAHLYASYCNHPIPPDGRGRRPFTGGQCPGIRYRCVAGATATRQPDGATFLVQSGGLVRGKITQCELVIDPTTFNTATCIIDGSADDDINVVLSVGSSNNGIDPVYTYSNFFGRCVPEDGSPDLCGDPPLIPPTVPPGSNNVPTNITYVNNEGVTVTVPVVIGLGYVRADFNGTFNMPITVRFNLDPTLNIRGDINLDGGHFTVDSPGRRPPPGAGTGSPDNVVRPPGNPPPTPPGIPPAPPAPPAPPPGTPPTPVKIIRGCIVTVSPATTDASIIFQEANPDIYAPSLGYVSFLSKVAGAYGWSADIPVKNRQQLISCPWQYGAVEVKGTAKGGASFQIEPIYDVLPPPAFPPT